MNIQHGVPDFKKGRGAVSVVLMSENGRSILVCKDLEKGSPGRRRWSLPGGIAEPADLGDMLRTATRECKEETGILLAPGMLVETPHVVVFKDGSVKKWFAGIYSENISLRTTGTLQEIKRNGVTQLMQVLGPPEWVPAEELMILPPQGYCPDDRFYLHHSQIKGLVEIILYLKGVNLDRRHAGFDFLWRKCGGKISTLRKRLHPEESGQSA